MQLKAALLLTLSTLCALPLLGSCGFTLRGSAELPPQLQTLQLESQDFNNELTRDLRRALESSEVTLIDSPEPGVYRLGIGNPQVTERVISVNAAARAGEYELTLSVPIRLTDPSGNILGTETIILDRTYLADPNNAVAKQDEAELILGEMQQEAVVQVLRRLQNLQL